MSQQNSPSVELSHHINIESESGSSGSGSATDAVVAQRPSPHPLVSGSLTPPRNDGRGGMNSVGQQAEDPSSGSDATPAGDDDRPDYISLRVCNSVTQEVVKHRCSPNITVNELKSRLFSKELSQGKNVRLIYHGQMLDQPSVPLSRYNIANDAFLHCVISEHVAGRPSSNRTPGHTDRAPTGDEADFDPSQDEEWLYQSEAMRPNWANPFQFENEGDNTDMFWGIVMGFLLGFIMIFWIWERTISRRQKIGIIIGIGLQFAYCLFRMMLTDK